MSERPALIIIGGGILSTYAIRRAQALGFTAICTDRDPTCPGALEADAFEQADVYSVNEQMVAALKLQTRYAKRLKGFFVGGIDAAHVAATVCQAMGWPGVNPQAAWLCRRKDLFRQRMQEAGVRQPDFHVLSLEKEVRLKPMVAPDRAWIIKSVENSAGRGHTVIQMPCDTDTWAAACRKAAAANVGHAKEILVEEYLPGREFSVEILAMPDFAHAVNLLQPAMHSFAMGRYACLNIVERYFAPHSRYPIEIGHVNPAPITPDEADKLYHLASQVARAVACDWGPFKIDAIWPADSPDPYVLEATCRWSGGFDSQETTPLSSGRDFIGFGLSLAAGGPARLDDPALQRRWRRAAAAWYPIPPPMILERIDTAAATRVAGVEKAIIMPSAVKGAKIEVIDSASRPVAVLASGETTEEALLAAKEGAERVNFYGRSTL